MNGRGSLPVDLSLSRARSGQLEGEPSHAIHGEDTRLTLAQRPEVVERSGKGWAGDVHLGLLLDGFTEELPVGVVLFGQVIQDRSALPDGEVVVLVVNDGGDPALLRTNGMDTRVD
jgi:hypothetical protein